MKLLQLLILSVFSLSSIAQSCAGNRIYVQPGGWGGAYMNAYQGVFKPGDTLVIRGTWTGGLDIENFHGTASCPIVIINEGVAKLPAGFKMSHCTYIKLTGSGTSTKYGFDISGNGTGPGVEITGRSANIEVERLRIYKKAYTAWVKQEAACADSLQYPNWWIDNISFHDCYSFNIGQDGLYFGSTNPTGGQRAVPCNGVNIFPVPLRLSNIRIYNNIIDSCNRTGIQLSGADRGNNAIYNNVVTRCGYEFNQTQGSGIILGGMTRAHIYGNKIRQTFQHGIFLIGSGFSIVENNNIDSSGMLGSARNPWEYTSIFADTRPTVPEYELVTLDISNNVVGKNTVVKGEHIIINNTNRTFSNDNTICGNTVQGTGAAASVYVAPGIVLRGCPDVPGPNKTPKAYAGTDQSYKSGIVLTGSGTDTDGSIVSYAWTKVSGPTCTIMAPNDRQTRVVGLKPGVYVFRLRVTDDKGAVAYDRVEVRVE